MGRRSDHSRGALRDLILASARDLVEREGFRALTARRVAEAVGYSPGTLYNLFSDLDDLVMRLNGRTLALLEEALASLPRSGRPESDLLALAAAYLAFLEKHRPLCEMLFEYRLGAGSEVPEDYAKRIERLLGHVEAALAPLFAPSEDAARARAAQALWSGLHGIGTLAVGGKLAMVSPHPASELARVLIGGCVRGLATGR